MEPTLRFLETQQIAPDTYVLRQLFGEGSAPVAVPVHSMVITGREPVIVDCGPVRNRDLWLEQVFSLVDPADVRWVYLSHDDPDHTGALHQVLDACPRATLVTNWFSMERMSLDGPFPGSRMRWVNDGESFHAGDRELVAVVPPVFDSPTTRGLFDRSTGVYWAGDACGSPLTHEVADVAELDPGFYREAYLGQQRMISPWLQWADRARYSAHVDRVASLGATTVASAHGVTLHGQQVVDAFTMLHELPDLPAFAWPGQSDLDAMIAATAQPPAPEPEVVEQAA